MPQTLDTLYTEPLGETYAATEEGLDIKVGYERVFWPLADLRPETRAPIKERRR